MLELGNSVEAQSADVDWTQQLLESIVEHIDGLLFPFDGPQVSEVGLRVVFSVFLDVLAAFVQQAHWQPDPLGVVQLPAHRAKLDELGAEVEHLVEAVHVQQRDGVILHMHQVICRHVLIL